MKRVILGGIFAVVLLLGCRKESDEFPGMVKIVHEQGKHKATQGSAYSNNRGNTIDIVFTNDSKYIHSHQSSWNKITGRGSIKLAITNGQIVKETEDLLAWRYVPDCDCFEVGEYGRERGLIVFPETIHRQKAFEKRTYSLAFIDYGLPIPLGAWFGGQIAPPHDLEYFIKIY